MKKEKVMSLLDVVGRLQMDESRP